MLERDTMWRRRLVRLTVAAWVVCAAALVTPAAAQLPAGEAPLPATAAAGRATVIFAAPEDGSMVSGPMAVEVRVAGPAPRSVSLFADGRLICTLETVPYSCSWDAGPRVVEHVLRAVVVAADGRRVARAIRTKGEPYAEGVDVDVVQVTASVLTGKGDYVRGLPRSAFRVFEDGVLQRISHFASENIPLEIIVAVDVSGSMTDAMPQVKQAVKTFLHALRPTDQVTVLGFNDNVFTLARPNADVATRVRAVDRLAPWGGTALYDVIVQAIDQLGRRTGRRVLVVFSDGEDRNSHIPLSTVISRIESRDVVVYPIGQGRATTNREYRAVLEQMAAKSGGQSFFTELQQLSDVFSRILAELSNQYLFGFAPPDSTRDGRWRAIKVECTDPSLAVRARQGYRLAPR